MAKSKKKKYYPPNPQGYTQKLTPELQAEICKLLEEGNYIETAAAFCGIHKSSIFSWMKIGREQAGSIYSDFLVAVKKASASSEINDLKKLANSDQWQAIAWRLERRFQKKWGKKEKHEVTGKNGRAITFSDFVKRCTQEMEEEEK